MICPCSSWLVYLRVSHDLLCCFLEINLESLGWQAQVIGAPSDMDIHVDIVYN